MLRFAASLLFLIVAAMPARAHFLWLLPDDGGKPGVRMVFSDKLAPDDAKFLDYIRKAEVFACGGDGKAVAVKTAQVKDALVPELTSPCVVAARVKIVSARGKMPALIVYHAKTWVGEAKPSPAMMKAAAGTLDFDLALDGAAGKLIVTWKGKPVAGAEVTLALPGSDEGIDLKTEADGTIAIKKTARPGLYGIRAKHVVARPGEFEGKKYDEERHYATLVFDTRHFLQSSGAQPRGAAIDALAQAPAKEVKEDADATKLLADARAARANWDKFPGFSADLAINVDGKVTNARVDVDAKGKVTLTGVEDAALEQHTRRHMASIVSHRMAGDDNPKTPCAFANTDDHHHPLGRAINVLNDEFHSSYRIRDRQVIVVNRSMKDFRFTITVMENMVNSEKQYLPTSYVVNSWDLKTNALRSSETFHHQWTRVGAYDLPGTATVVKATTDGKQEARQLKLTNHKLK
jgi:hypothetical protein